MCNHTSISIILKTCHRSQWANLFNSAIEQIILRLVHLTKRIQLLRLIAIDIVLKIPDRAGIHCTILTSPNCSADKQLPDTSPNIQTTRQLKM